MWESTAHRQSEKVTAGTSVPQSEGWAWHCETQQNKDHENLHSQRDIAWGRAILNPYPAR